MSEQGPPTRGQLERNLSQNIQKFYREQLGHQPSKVSCDISGDKITIIVEGAVTQPEQLLASQGEQALTEEVRSNLNKMIEDNLKRLIGEIVGVEVIDLLNDTKIDTERAGLIAILATKPETRRRRKSS